jgi:HK97 family phage prohead protease
MSDRDIEYRAQKQLELRCPSGTISELVGYASTFDTPYEVDGTVETISPSAFERTLRDKPDVFALVGHDPSRVVGRTSNKTLTLATDEHGLKVTLRPVDTQEGRDLVALVRSGTLDSMSFGFIVRDDQLEVRDGKVHRSITDLELHEVSVVAYPANSAARISARAKKLSNDLYAARARSLRGLEAQRRLLIPPLGIFIGGSQNGTV